MDFVVKGNFIDTPEIGKLRYQCGYAVVLNGILFGIFDAVPEEYQSLPITDYGDSLIIPGMTDLHLHAPQYSYAGTAMDVQLLEWLSKYTYPEESKYSDIVYAEKGYAYFVGELLKTTTTRACIFATLHTDATLELMDQLDKAGIIAFVGKLNMNRNAPEYYCEESTEYGMKETKRWINSCSFEHVKPMITPRFTPSVTDDYMKALGSLAKEYHLPMQSHLDENKDEIAWVKSLCPEAANYAETYHRYGLFGKDIPTIMAHCIYCNEDENKLIKENGVMIAHCPTSNENVIAGICPAAYYLRKDYRIGLGSDVAGGHTLNLMEVMTAAVQVSKLRTLLPDEKEKPLTLPEAFYMATAGGGSFFGKVGKFDAEYEFDACVIRDRDIGNPRNFDAEEKLEHLAYTQKYEVAAKYVRGTKIF